MNIFRVPYQYPQNFDAGTQLFNPGTGGPSSHFRELASAPIPYPVVYMVGAMGIGNMPRQIMGVAPIVDVNQYAGSLQALLIPGLQKASR